MSDGQLNNLKILKPIRQSLRNDATEAEKQLWQSLKGSQLAGRKFRRQHSVGYFILDFYCPSEQLTIELDGHIHDTSEVKIYDSERQKAIETLGIKILRFRNDDVFQRIDYVLKVIEENFKGNQPPPTPS
ncbi:endonuclease domain-containing protein [Spirosoma daeguense]